MASQRREVPPEKKMEDYLKGYTYWAYACSRVIAENVASVPYKLVYVKPDGTEEDVEDHAFLQLMEASNPWMTEFELREMTQIHLELVGEAWWVFEKSKLGLEAEIWPLMPHYVTILPGSNSYMDGIRYAIPGEPPVTYGVEEVVQFKYSNPTSFYRGWSPTRAASIPLDVMNYAQEWVRNFFFNDATPSGILSTDQLLTESQANLLQTQWTASHKGRQKAHRIAVLGQGTKFQVIERNLRELTFTEEQRRLRDDVLAIYGVPKAVLGIVEDVNRANAEASEYVFAKRVIAPRLRRLESRLNEYVIKRLYNDERLRLRFEDPVPENREQKKVEAEFGLSKGLLTVNEARLMMGLDSLEKDYGEVLYVPTNVLPTRPEDLLTLADQTAEPPPDPTSPTTDPNAEIDADGDGVIGETDTDTDPPDDATAPEKDDDDAPEKGEKALSYEARWKAWVKMTAPHERRFAAEMKRFFQAQQNWVMGRLKEKGKAVRTPQGSPPDIEVEQYLWDTEDAQRDLERRIGPILRGIVITAGQGAMADLGLSIAFDIEHPGVVTGLTDQLFKIVGLVDPHTREHLRQELVQGLTLGEGIPKLADRVTRVFGQAKGRRAQTIARTETNGAASLGTQKAWEQSGVVKGKEWVSAADERSRSHANGDPFDHVVAQGEIVPLDGKFFRTGEPLPYPGFYGGSAANIINCRCAMAPVTKTQT